MFERSGIAVSATGHVIKQARARVVRLGRWSDPQARRWVERTVYRAIRDGRKAKTCPGWCRSWQDSPGRKKSDRYNRTQRYVWDADETCVFVVARRQGSHDTGRVWVVVTVLVDDPDARVG